MSNNRTLSIQDLPTEIKLLLFNFSTTSDNMRFAQTCRGFLEITHQDFLWKNLYERDFGPLIFQDHPRLQYILAYLFNQAFSCPQPNKQQILYKNFYDYASTHSDKVFVTSYLGYMNYHGLGTPQDPTLGLQRLIDSWDNNDLYAPLTIAELLLWRQNSAKTIEQMVGAARIARLIPLIKQLHQLYSLGTCSRVIAHLYLNGIGCDQNRSEAEKWFLTAMHDVY